MNTRVDQIALLLRQTAEAHHEAYLSSDGSDPEWPLWYADYLWDKLPQLLAGDLTRSELVYLLVLLDRRMAEEDSSAPWYDYYAAYLASRSV